MFAGVLLTLLNFLFFLGFWLLSLLLGFVIEHVILLLYQYLLKYKHNVNLKTKHKTEIARKFLEYDSKFYNAKKSFFVYQANPAVTLNNEF